MTAAIEATKQYLDDIKAAVDEHALRLLFGVGPTLAVAMDTTGSMGPVINIARNTAINIARSRVGTADEPSLYVVSSFNDPGTGPLTVTSKLDVFEATVNGLFPYAGGDCPELMMTGMLDALNVMEKGSTLFAFTDAAPKDVDLESSVIATAADKYINIYIFKYDSFCDDGIDSSGGGGGLRKRVDSLSDRAYSEICAATGGQYFSGPVAEVAKIGDILDTLITGESSAILRVQDSLAAGETKTFDVPVDSYMKKVTFSLQGVGASLAVTQPDGAPLPASGVAGVVVTTLSDSTFISVSPPTPGIYKVAVTSQAGSSFSLICMGNSPLYLSSFNFASVRGRAGHTGWYALPAGTPPPFNQKIGVVSELAGPIGPSSGVVFSLRSPSFAPIVANAGLSSGSGEDGAPPKNSFFGIVQLPNAGFLTYVSGPDDKGVPFQRVVEGGVTVPVASEKSYNLGSNSTLPSTPSAGISTTLPSETGRWSNTTAPSLTTSTIYATRTYTVTSCAPTVTHCPALGSVVTETTVVGVTVCPVGGGKPEPTQRHGKYTTKLYTVTACPNDGGGTDGPDYGKVYTRTIPVGGHRGGGGRGRGSGDAGPTVPTKPATTGRVGVSAAAAGRHGLSGPRGWMILGFLCLGPLLLL